MAYFDKAIPPGGKGKITLSVKTEGYQGAIHKTAKVYTNDPASSLVTLDIKAFIKVPIYLSSRYVNFYGKEGQILTRVIEIKAQLDKPLELTPAEFNLSDMITYTLEEIEKGRKFQIRFTSTPGPHQSYRGFLKLRTNYPEKPEITLWIRGRVQKKI